ncbi:MAG: DNA-directed RNA polymerase subunit beta', partial [Magnetococcales bacterium]|nr:DNA-directed RNA polymerase subunit beta' [Magnetococcales bacterium]
PVTDALLVKAGTIMNEADVERIENSNVESVLMRSPLTCSTERGVCILCYGRDLARGVPVTEGEAVGVIAAQSIGEPGTQLTMRTFHIGGTASRAVERSSIETVNGGVMRYHNLSTVTDRNGQFVVLSRNSEVTIHDARPLEDGVKLERGFVGRERERYRVPYGARLTVANGGFVEKGGILAEWDPFATPIITEFKGEVRYVDLQEGATLREVTDETTGLTFREVTDWKGQARRVDMRPRLVLKDPTTGESLISQTGAAVCYYLPAGAVIVAQEADHVQAGDIIAKIPRQSSKTRDITGGLPRVVELFEARRPKEFAIIAENEGVVSFGKDLKGKRRVVVTPDDGSEAREYLLLKGKQLAVNEGDWIRRGEPLIEGSLVPQDILKVLGLEALCRFMVNEIQEVYRLQGVRINDKHIEVIVRQMLQKITVIDPGDTTLVSGEQVERTELARMNEKARARGGQEATSAPLLLGITKASLSTPSFISAASFQETTRVLTEATISGKADTLTGLKENVIVGRLVPAGTGHAKEVFNRKVQMAVS